MRAATHSPYLCSEYAPHNQLRGCAEGALDAVIMDSLPNDYGIIQADPVAEAIASGHYGSMSHDNDKDAASQALPSDRVQLQPLSPEEAALIEPRTVRQSHEARCKKLLSKDILCNELLTWECKNCNCLLDVKTTDAAQREWLGCAMRLREITCKLREQAVRPHIRTILASLLRLTRTKLQYIVGGIIVCKEAFIWAHGFSVPSFNREHAQFNTDFQDSNPINVTYFIGLACSVAIPVAACVHVRAISC